MRSRLARRSQPAQEVTRAGALGHGAEQAPPPLVAQPRAAEGLLQPGVPGDGRREPAELVAQREDGVSSLAVRHLEEGRA